MNFNLRNAGRVLAMANPTGRRRYRLRTVYQYVFLESSSGAEVLRIRSPPALAKFLVCKLQNRDGGGCQSPYFLFLV